MEHWQQKAYREDPYDDFTFYDERAERLDKWVAVTLLIALLIGLFA